MTIDTVVKDSRKMNTNRYRCESCESLRTENEIWKTGLEEMKSYVSTVQSELSDLKVRLEKRTHECSDLTEKNKGLNFLLEQQEAQIDKIILENRQLKSSNQKYLDMSSLKTENQSLRDQLDKMNLASEKSDALLLSPSLVMRRHSSYSQQTPISKTQHNPIQLFSGSGTESILSGEDIQAEKAQQQNGRLLDLETNLSKSTRRVESLEKQLSDLRSENVQLQQINSDLHKRSQSMESDLSSKAMNLEAQVLNLEAQVLELTSENQALVRDYNNKLNQQEKSQQLEIELLENRLSEEYSLKVKTLTEQVLHLEERVLLLGEENASLEKDFTTKVNDLENNRNHLKAKVSFSEQQVSNLLQKNESLMQDCSSLREKQGLVEAKLSEKDNLISLLQNQNATRISQNRRNSENEPELAGAEPVSPPPPPLTSTTPPILPFGTSSENEDLLKDLSETKSSLKRAQILLKKQDRFIFQNRALLSQINQKQEEIQSLKAKINEQETEIQSLQKETESESVSEYDEEIKSLQEELTEVQKQNLKLVEESKQFRSQQMLNQFTTGQLRGSLLKKEKENKAILDNLLSTREKYDIIIQELQETHREDILKMEMDVELLTNFANSVLEQVRVEDDDYEEEEKEEHEPVSNDRVLYKASDDIELEFKKLVEEFEAISNTDIHIEPSVDECKTSEELSPKTCDDSNERLGNSPSHTSIKNQKLYLDSLSSSLLKGIAERKELRNENNFLKTRSLYNLKADKASTTDKSSLQNQIQSLMQDLEKKEKSLQELQSSHEKLKTEISKKSSHILSLESEKEVLQKEYDDILSKEDQAKEKASIENSSDDMPILGARVNTPNSTSLTKAVYTPDTSSISSTVSSLDISTRPLLKDRVRAPSNSINSSSISVMNTNTNSKTLLNKMRVSRKKLKRSKPEDITNSSVLPSEKKNFFMKRKLNVLNKKSTML